MRRGSLNLLRTELKGYNYIEALCRLVECVNGELRPAALILFGSLARGDFHEYSDADLCVVLHGEAIHPLARSVPVEPFNPTGVAEAQTFGAEEFKEMLREANPLALEILHYGLVLGGEESFIEELETIFEETRQKWGLEKTPGGWRMAVAG